MRKKKKKTKERRGFVDVFLEAAEQYSIFSLTKKKKEEEEEEEEEGLYKYKKKGRDANIIIVKAHTPPGLPLGHHRRERFSRDSGNAGCLRSAARRRRRRAAVAAVRRETTVRRLGLGYRVGLSVVLGQDEDSVFLNGAHRRRRTSRTEGYWHKTSARWDGSLSRRSARFPFPLSLSLSLREEREREDETDRTRVTRSKLFAFIRLFLSRANHPLNAHTHSLFDSPNERMHRSRLYRLVCASPRKRRRIVKRPPLVFGLMPDRDTSPRRRTVPRTSSNTWV